jgi:hypothetical protein
MTCLRMPKHNRVVVLMEEEKSLVKFMVRKTSRETGALGSYRINGTHIVHDQWNNSGQLSRHVLLIRHYRHCA